MKIRKIHISNYRAIEDIIINLNYSINPIIGVNESGKTSVLQAILALDKSRDKYNKGEHLEYKNKYSLVDQRCEISAFLTLTADDISRLIIYCKVKTNAQEYNVLQSLNERLVFKLTRILSDDNSYTLECSLDLSEDLKKKVLKWLISNFPMILYFDDFTDRVPDEIPFPADFETRGNYSRGVMREWQQIIVEIFKRAGIQAIDGEDNPLQSFMHVENPDKRDDILSDIVDILNEEIIEEWKKIKKRGNNKLADDSEQLEISLKNSTRDKFEFKVRDKSAAGKKRTFNVRERSKGFQWFFNYMLKLKFNPRYNQTEENSLFLLDEPGSYLHSSAQSELLKELKRVSKKNTIVYCTHSQFLLNPEDIKLGSIKIADKDSSKVNLIPFGEYPSSKDRGALSPIYQALNMNFARDFIGNILLFEGITDFYFFKIMQKHWGVLNDYNLMAGTGAGNLSNLIGLCFTFSEDFRIVLDNDSGKTALKKYKEQFSESITKKVLFYGGGDSKFRLEDHLTKTTAKKILEKLNTNSLKKAIPEIFFEDISSQEQILSLFDKQSESRIRKSIEKLNFLG